MSFLIRIESQVIFICVWFEEEKKKIYNLKKEITKSANFTSTEGQQWNKNKGKDVAARFT